MRGGDAIDPEFLQGLALDIRAVCAQGVQVAIVVGGGNIFRGLAGSSKGMERTTADHMGMLATVINSLALRSAFERQGVEARVQSAIFMPQVAELYTRNGAVKHLEQGRVVIFAAGTGNPFFTTDTAAALRANEIGAEIVFKATKVDGIYDSDPVKNPNAKRYDVLSYSQVLTDNLGVMDAAAVSLCRENKLPILVFNLMTPGNIVKALQGGAIGTMVKGD